MKKADDRHLKLLKHMPTIILLVTFLLLALIVNVQAIVENSNSSGIDRDNDFASRLHRGD